MLNGMNEMEKHERYVHEKLVLSAPPIIDPSRRFLLKQRDYVKG